MTVRQTVFTRMPGLAQQLFFCMLGILFATTADATSVRAVNMAEMLGESALVFEGRVVSLQARQDAGTGTIRTYATFEVLDVLKGNYPDSTIELSFLGGTVDGVTLKTADMQMPEVGEQGIYFVESLQRRQVHPLYGWAQGHFLVVADERGVRRVLTKSRRPVTAMQYGPQVRALSDGIARGITVTESDDVTDAMTVGEFKQQLSTMLQAVQ